MVVGPSEVCRDEVVCLILLALDVDRVAEGLSLVVAVTFVVVDKDDTETRDAALDLEVYDFETAVDFVETDRGDVTGLDVWVDFAVLLVLGVLAEAVVRAVWVFFKLDVTE